MGRPIQRGDDYDFEEASDFLQKQVAGSEYEQIVNQLLEGNEELKDQLFDGLNMREVHSQVMDQQLIFPMKIPKPRGLGKLLNPERADKPPEYDHQYPWGLQPFDFDPPDTDLHPGEFRPSMVDRLLSHHEEEGILSSPRGDPERDPLSSVEGWFQALMLPEDARIRRTPRFVRVLEEYTQPHKYSDDQRRQMLHSLKFGLAHDPLRAGYKDGVLPYTVEKDGDLPGYHPEEMDEFRFIPPTMKRDQ